MDLTLQISSHSVTVAGIVPVISVGYRQYACYKMYIISQILDFNGHLKLYWKVENQEELYIRLTVDIGRYLLSIIS